MLIENISLIIRTISTVVTATNIYTKIKFPGKLSENEVTDFIEPVYNDLLRVKRGLQYIEIDKININLSEKIDSLKSPKFFKDNEKILKDLETLINNISKQYRIICASCTGIVNEALKEEDLHYCFKPDELGELPSIMGYCIFNYNNREVINKISTKLHTILEQKFPNFGLNFNETNINNNKINYGIIKVIDRICDIIDLSSENSIKRFFNIHTERIPATPKQDILKKYVASFFKDITHAHIEVTGTIEEIKNHYEKFRPKNS
ncbi:hypothetical protein ACJDU8_02335 [Clostridium sp. WILCCON 0269]|uniref:Uncharacterized protein n=1 Tax=Candidatus Clostridium eludens TaxID=3381663 RepID=A0ABW8SHS0_9CLOT